MSSFYKELGRRQRDMPNGCVREEILSLIKVFKGVCVVSSLTSDVAVARSRSGPMSTNQGAKGNRDQEGNEKKESDHREACQRRTKENRVVEGDQEMEVKTRRAAYYVGF